MQHNYYSSSERAANDCNKHIQYVCLSTHSHISTLHVQISQNFLYTLLVAIARSWVNWLVFHPEWHLMLNICEAGCPLFCCQSAKSFTGPRPFFKHWLLTTRGVNSIILALQRQWPIARQYIITKYWYKVTVVITRNKKMVFTSIGKVLVCKVTHGSKQVNEEI